MEWLDRVMDGIKYLEAHIEEPFDSGKVAKAACSSTFHFQRMFHMLTGVTLAEYVRNRRLTLAAQELNSKKSKVLDIALKYGYETPEAFSKAFRKVHGVSPSAAREPGVKLKAFPPISFQISIKGAIVMEYKIVEKDEFSIVGNSKKMSTRNGENLKRIPEFWREYTTSGKWSELCKEFNVKQTFGVCKDMELDKEAFTYMIAAQGGSNYKGNKYEVQIIEKSCWAVFSVVGAMPEAIQKCFERIYQEWFPTSEYEHTGGPEFEVYPEGDTSQDDYYSEIWIPVKMK